MRTLSITLLSLIGLISSLTAEIYAKLEVTYRTQKVDDRAYGEKATYYWKSTEETFAGELVDLSKKLKIGTSVEGEFTEFHLISGILRRGWSLNAVEATPPYFGHTDGPKFYRQRTKVFHFTRPDPQPASPSTKKGEGGAGQPAARSESK